MEIALNLLIILIASFVLVKAVSLFINSTTKISHHFKISGYTISFLVVSIATSLPEIVIGITTALQDKQLMAYGNALGSNIALFTLVIAVAAFLSTGIKTEHIFRSNDVYFSSILSLIAVALALDGEISRLNGIMLILGYIFYALAFIKRSTVVEKIFGTFEKINIWKEGVIFFVSLAILIYASEWIVNSALNLSSLLNLGVGFVGLTITAIGTSLPEIAYSVVLVRKNDQDEILGNVIGSIAANSTIVLGITALINPIVINNGGISFTTYSFAVLATLLFLGFTKTKEKLDTLEATLLFFVYIGFLVAEYLIQ